MMGQITGWTMNRGRQLLLVSIESHWFMKRLAHWSYSPENDIYIEKWCSLLSRSFPLYTALLLASPPSLVCPGVAPSLASSCPWVYTWLFRMRRSCKEAFNYPLGLSDIKRPALTQVWVMIHLLCASDSSPNMPHAPDYYLRGRGD